MLRVCPIVATLVVVWLPAAALAQKAEEPEKAAEKPKAVKEEQVHKVATKRTYSDGTIELDIKGREKNNPLTFFRPSGPKNPELVPSEGDGKCGYVLFVPSGRNGVLPEYRPAADELGGLIRIFASPGEFELATFCLRPLRDLGEVKFRVGRSRIPRERKWA